MPLSIQLFQSHGNNTVPETILTTKSWGLLRVLQRGEGGGYKMTTPELLLWELIKSYRELQDISFRSILLN